MDAKCTQFLFSNVNGFMLTPPLYPDLGLDMESDMDVPDHKAEESLLVTYDDNAKRLFRVVGQTVMPLT